MLIERVREFRYLGRVLSEDDKDTVCIQGQIKRVRQWWRRMTRVLKQDGMSARTMAKFYITSSRLSCSMTRTCGQLRGGTMQRLSASINERLGILPGVTYAIVRKASGHIWTMLGSLLRITPNRSISGATSRHIACISGRV